MYALKSDYVVQDNPPITDNDKLILAKIADLSSELGLDLVSVSSAIYQVTASHHEQSEVFKQLSRNADDVNKQSINLAHDVKHAEAQVNSSSAEVRTRIEKSEETVNSIMSWNDSAISAANRINSLSKSLDNITNLSKTIEAIASNTNLLALNATIEAARAGDAGRGFAVVAKEVKDLSTQTKNASVMIQETLRAISNEIMSLKVNSDENLKLSELMTTEMQHERDSLAMIQGTFDIIGDTIRKVVDGSNIIEDKSTHLKTSLDELTADVNNLDNMLKDAGGNLDKVVNNGEAIMQAASCAGVNSTDSHLIKIAQETAMKIGNMYSDAIKTNKISRNDLFDDNYREISNSSPPQYMTRFVDFTDKILPDLQEQILISDERIVFCAAFDRNCFLPTHNKKFSMAQRHGDYAWNMANSRNRRIFDDRVGTKTAKNKNGPLVQAYRRDMGNGEYIMMKDISFPIMVDGVHWGAFRMGVKVR